MKNNFEVHTPPDGKTSIKVRYQQDTSWLTQLKMGELFVTTSGNLLMHWKNIHKDQEHEEVSAAKKFSVVQTEGQRLIKRNLQHYNLLKEGEHRKSSICEKFALTALDVESYLIWCGLQGSAK